MKRSGKKKSEFVEDAAAEGEDEIEDEDEDEEQLANRLEDEKRKERELEMKRREKKQKKKDGDEVEDDDEEDDDDDEDDEEEDDEEDEEDDDGFVERDEVEDDLDLETYRVIDAEMVARKKRRRPKTDVVARGDRGILKRQKKIEKYREDHEAHYRRNEPVEESEEIVQESAYEETYPPEVIERRKARLEAYQDIFGKEFMTQQAMDDGIDDADEVNYHESEDDEDEDDEEVAGERLEEAIHDNVIEEDGRGARTRSRHEEELLSILKGSFGGEDAKLLDELNGESLRTLESFRMATKEDLRSMYCTPRDLLIVQRDIPERLQEYGILVASTREDVAAEAKWVYHEGRERFGGLDEFPIVQEWIRNVLHMILFEFFEVNFIFYFRRERIGRLLLDELWMILELHQKYVKVRAIVSRVRKLAERLNDSERMAVEVLVRNVPSENEAVDALNYVKYLLTLRKRRQEWGMSEGDRKVDEAQAALEMKDSFGLTIAEYAENLENRVFRHIVDTPEHNYEDHMIDISNRYNIPYGRVTVVSGKVPTYAAIEMCMHPVFRAALRDAYLRKAYFSTKPTKLGKRVIVPGHVYSSVKWVKEKPIAAIMNHSDEQMTFLLMIAAEKQKLIEISLRLTEHAVQSIMEEDICIRYFQSSNTDEHAKMWNQRRLGLIREALDESLSRMKKHIILEVQAKCEEIACLKCQEVLFEKWLLSNPPNDDNNVVAVASGAQQGDLMAFVCLAPTGELISVEYCDGFQRGQKFSDFETSVLGKLQAFANEHRARYYVLGAEREEIRHIYNVLARINYDIVYAPMDLARIYAQSKRGIREFEQYSTTVRKAVSLGRLFLDPVREVCGLWNPENDIKKLMLHPTQKHVAWATLEKKLSIVVCDRVAKIGIDWRRVKELPHHTFVLQFVCGFGKRKAYYCLNKMESQLNERLRRIPCLKEGGNVWYNAIGFLRMNFSDPHAAMRDIGGHGGLDGTRIHPESFLIVGALGSLYQQPARDEDVEDEDDDPLKLLARLQEKIHPDFCHDVTEYVEHRAELIRRSHEWVQKHEKLIQTEMVHRHFSTQLLHDKLDEADAVVREHLGESKYHTLLEMAKQIQNPWGVSQEPRDLRGKDLMIMSPKDVFHAITGLDREQMCKLGLVCFRITRIHEDDVLTEMGKYCIFGVVSGANVRVRVSNRSLGYVKPSDVHGSLLERGVKPNAVVVGVILEIDYEHFSCDASLDPEEVSSRREAIKKKNEQSMDESGKEEEIKIEQHKKIQKRQIGHPFFQNFAKVEAAEYLRSQPEGTIVIHPSEKGNDWLSFSVAFWEEVLTFDVREKDKPNPMGLGTRLFVRPLGRRDMTAWEEYEDLDEICESFVTPILEYSQAVREHVFFVGGDNLSLENDVRRRHDKAPRQLVYRVGRTPGKPGTFTIAHMASKRVQRVNFTVTHEGYVFRKELFQDINAVLEKFENWLLDAIRKARDMRENIRKGTGRFSSGPSG
eukprot:TRINITY_DN1741_c1_g2_i1.p1 TRINITY_DN1741_c1_g2~~TRINITY_DN1741_c1_g2_i1.p1  ORF type:complete len:1478 (+),score=456.87 TRINITY_DN1741_c1_g2_i1:131-4564(+)